jgi:hypothetical protein
MREDLIEEQLINLKRIPKYNGYGVDKEGKVYSFKSKKFLKQGYRKGYRKVNLCKEGKCKEFSVHRIIAMIFIPNPENKPFVNHIDSNRENNHVLNLEWSTASENTIHGWRKGFIVGHNKPHSSEAKERISKGKEGAQLSEETKAKMSKAKIGFKHSELTKLKISKASKYTRNIKNTETGEEYKSITAASIFEDISQSTIYRGLKDGRYEYIN